MKTLLILVLLSILVGCGVSPEVYRKGAEKHGEVILQLNADSSVFVIKNKEGEYMLLNLSNGYTDGSVYRRQSLNIDCECKE